MQRKNIDELEYFDLKAGLLDPRTSEGTITVVSGEHTLYGALILVAASDAYTVLGNDVRLIVGEGETLEADMAEA